jgi:hypothetical protein
MTMRSSPYANLLQRMNGYVAYYGALHVRGACREPLWHSLRYAWTGDGALHRLYPNLSVDDIPFAEDAIGDQYVLRDGAVHQLSGETGEVTSRGMDIVAFDAAVRANPFEFLVLGPLQQFIDEGAELRPGDLLSVMPPLVIDREPGERTSVRAIPARERIEWLAMFARKIHDLPEGAHITFTAGDD